MSYVNSGAYNASFFHRSVFQVANPPSIPVDFKVIQGGGYYVDLTTYQFAAITPKAAVIGEHSLSNTRGTLAMALSNGPDSGTNQWYFNESDNSAALRRHQQRRALHGFRRHHQ